MPKCYSVRLQSLVSISPKCYKAVAFDGSECLIPKSVVYGQDYEVSKSDAYWIASWFLEKEDVKIQYSRKKWTLFTKDGKNVGRIEVEHHTPERVEPVLDNTIKELIK